MSKKPVVSKVAKRKQKDKNAPKKPMSAFFCYQQARREPLKKEAPELDHRDIIKVILSLTFQLSIENERGMERYE